MINNAAGSSFDGNRDNGEDKIIIYSKRKAPDSGSEGRKEKGTSEARSMALAKVVESMVTTSRR
jgi:hypothetical protein